MATSKAVAFQNKNNNIQVSTRSGKLRFLAAIGLCSIVALGIGAPTIAVADTATYRLDIPAQPLADALKALGAAANEQLLFADKIVIGHTTQPLKGQYTTEQALAALLRGTDLKADRTPTGVLLIRPKTQTTHESGKGEGVIPSPREGRGARGEGPSNEGSSKSWFTRLARGSSNAAGESASENSPRSSDKNSADSESPRLEQITVTAQKYEQNLQDVPISIQTFSAQDIQAKSVNGLQELAQFTPNLTFSNGATTGNSRAVVFIRGIGQTGFDPGVGVYVDGVYLGGQGIGLDLDLVDAGRVEILRGPQGTLFGKNTVGGAINVISAMPGDEFGGSIEVTTGRFDRIDGKLGLNIPLIPGKLAARFTGAARNRDGYGKQLDFATGEVIKDMGNIDHLAGRLMLDWTPIETLDVLLSVDASKRREHGNPHKLAAAGQPAAIALTNLFVNPDYGNVFITDSPFTSYGSGGNKSDLDSSGASLIVTWDVGGGWAVKSLTSHREAETFYSSDPDGSPYFILNSLQDGEQDLFSQEFLLTGSSFDRRLQSVFGLFYLEEDSFGRATSEILTELYNAIGLDRATSVSAEGENKSWSAFAHGSYALTDRLSMTTGLRYTEDKKETSDERINPRSGIVTAPLASGEGSWDAISGRFGFEYRWTDDFMTFVSAARGFKSGGINTRSTQGPPLFDPEFVWTYEVGVKSDLFDRRARLNAAVFYSDYDNIQFGVVRADSTGQPISFIDNAAKARIRGFETELTVLPARGLTFSAGVGYIDAEYTELEPGSTVTLDTKFIETPEWTATLSGEYSMPLGDWARLTGRLDYAYKTEVEHLSPSTPISLQDAYGLLNARLTLASDEKGWSVAVFGTNLTDEEYILGAIDFTGSLGFGDVQYARPREWGLSVGYSF